MDVFGGERLHQAAERQLGHREIGRSARHEETGDPEIGQPDRDGIAGRTVGQLEVDQRKIGVVPFGGLARRRLVLRAGDHAIARIVLDQIFERGRKLGVVLDDQDPEHMAFPPHRNRQKQNRPPRQGHKRSATPRA